MTINAPSNLSAMVNQNSMVMPVWAIYFTQVFKALTGSGGPFPLQSYLVANLPAASKNMASLIFVSNESGGATVAFSDGTNWRRVQDRNIVG